MVQSAFPSPLHEIPSLVLSHRGVRQLPENAYAEPSPVALESKLACQNLCIYYGETQVVFNVDLDVHKNEVMSLIGPSGSGKTSLLRCLNRMNDQISTCRVTGSVWFEGNDIYAGRSDAVATRMAIGMVFQKPNPYPRSIYENIAYGLRIHGRAECVAEERVLVEKCLRQTGLWAELGQRLWESALDLSMGQQQRLCIARVLALNPDVILMDEPCSSLDPISTASVEKLIRNLGRRMAIVVVTQSLQQAARISSKTAFLHQGRLIEVGPTARLFSSPRHTLTERYLSGRLIF